MDIRMYRRHCVWYWNVLVWEFGLDSFLEHTFSGTGKKNWDKLVEDTPPHLLWTSFRWTCKKNNLALYEAMKDRLDSLPFCKRIVENYLKHAPKKDLYMDVTSRWETYTKRVKKGLTYVKETPIFGVASGRNYVGLTDEGKMTWSKAKYKDAIKTICYVTSKEAAIAISNYVHNGFFFTKEEWDEKGGMNNFSNPDKNMYTMAEYVWNTYANTAYPILPMNIHGPVGLMYKNGEYYLWLLRNDFIKADKIKGKLYV